MHAIMSAIASLFNTILPDWVRLPDLTFTMPHPIYWAGLVLFPLIAMFLIRRAAIKQVEKPDRVTRPIAYLLWLCGGMVGLHRFYARSAKVGFAFLVLFVLVLYGNSQGSLARNANSEAVNDFRDAEFQVEHYQKRVDKGRAGAQEKLDAATEAMAQAEVAREQTGEVLADWRALVGGLALLIAIGMAIDIFLIPGIVRRCATAEADAPPPSEFSVMERGPKYDPRREITNAYIVAVEKLSGASGVFVAYWSMIAVFVYYYEVIARYVFNSPTNWAHESMFLMFGMQYLLSGAFALRDDAHVRVDVIYEKFSAQTRTMIDIVTSFFFFVFTLTLMGTGYLFAMDSVDVWEVSFTEWGIQYWPVKLTIVLGAILLTLQGSVKLMRDVLYYLQLRAQ